MKTRPLPLFQEFIRSEKASGIVIMFAIATSLALANIVKDSPYLHFWEFHPTPFLSMIHLDISSLHWVNDGLMAVFFLLVGLEIEREIYSGELNTFRSAALPFVAALGGMLVPAGIYLSLNAGQPGSEGFGIPMATDIAIALAVLSMAGNRFPVQLKIMLTAFAVIDDLGAILIIAFFYADTLSFGFLAAAICIFIILIIFNRTGVRHLYLYLLPGMLMWYMFYRSGVHATISGVLLAFVIPYQGGRETSPSYILQHRLHYPVAFFILPLFALANSAIGFGGLGSVNLFSGISLGIFAGLVAGKPLGIFLFTFFAHKLVLIRLQPEITYKRLLGLGFLGGIGFTMSIFVTLLAFDTPDDILSAKITIVISSFIAGITGLTLLRKA